MNCIVCVSLFLSSTLHTPIESGCVGELTCGQNLSPCQQLTRVLWRGSLKTSCRVHYALRPWHHSFAEGMKTGVILTPSWDVQSTGVQLRSTFTITAVCYVLGYVRHIHKYCCGIELLVPLQFARMVAVHGARAPALKGAVHLETGAYLHHRFGAQPDGAGLHAWEQKSQLICSCISNTYENVRRVHFVVIWST